MSVCTFIVQCSSVVHISILFCLNYKYFLYWNSISILHVIGYKDCGVYTCDAFVSTNHGGFLFLTSGHISFGIRSRCIKIESAKFPQYFSSKRSARTSPVLRFRACCSVRRAVWITLYGVSVSHYFSAISHVYSFNAKIF